MSTLANTILLENMVSTWDMALEENDITACRAVEAALFEFGFEREAQLLETHRTVHEQ